MCEEGSERRSCRRLLPCRKRLPLPVHWRLRRQEDDQPAPAYKHLFGKRARAGICQTGGRANACTQRTGTDSLQHRHSGGVCARSGEPLVPALLWRPPLTIKLVSPNTSDSQAATKWGMRTEYQWPAGVRRAREPGAHSDTHTHTFASSPPASLSEHLTGNFRARLFAAVFSTRSSEFASQSQHCALYQLARAPLPVARF